MCFKLSDKSLEHYRHDSTGNPSSVIGNVFFPYIFIIAATVFLPVLIFITSQYAFFTSSKSFLPRTAMLHYTQPRAVPYNFL